MITMIHNLKTIKTSDGRFIPLAKVREYSITEKPYHITPKWRVLNHIFFTTMVFEEEEYFKLMETVDSDDGYVNEKGLYYKKDLLLEDLKESFKNAVTVDELLYGFDLFSARDAEIYSEEELLSALEKNSFIKVRRHSLSLEAI